jgi:hypothetical protein
MRSGAIELRGGAWELSKRVNEGDALGVADSFSAVGSVASGTWTDCAAAAATDAARKGSSWHACPALNDALCPAPAES